MAHFGGGASTFAVSSSSSSSAAATDRTAEFLRLAAAAKAAQVRGGIFSWYFASVSLSSLSRATKRERESEQEREREERERKARMVIFFSIDGLSTFVSPFPLDSTSSPCPLFPSILSTHRTRRVCLTREVRSGGRADFREGKKEEENSKTAASPFFSSSFLSFNLHLSLPPLASFGTAPSFAPSSITSSSANPFSAASSTATAQSDFARRAAAVGAGIHTTSERLKALAALARRTSSFDDPAAEIADLSARIKRDIAGLNGALSELAAVGARSRAAAAASSAASSAAAQQQQHSATVVDGLRLRLRDAASQFRDVLDARQKSLAAHADRRARFSSAAGASTSSSATGAGAAAAAAGAAGAAPAAPLPPFGRGGSSLAPRHQPLFAPRPPPRPPMGGASAGNGGPASAAFAGTTTTAAAAEKCVSDSSNPSSSFSSAAAAPSFPQPPPLGTAQPFLRQRGGMARYGGGGGGGGGGAR
jgi:hypothetical protein